MKQILIILLIFIFIDADELKNELAQESSPYLQQRATNPINWLP